MACGYTCILLEYEGAGKYIDPSGVQTHQYHLEESQIADTAALKELALSYFGASSWSDLIPCLLSKSLLHSGLFTSLL